METFIPSIDSAHEILNLPSEVINTQRREEYQSALLQVLATQGTETAISYIYVTVARGVEIPLATVATTKLMTVSGAYSRCAKVIEDLYAQNYSDTYVSYFLGSALASSAEFEKLSKLASNLIATELNSMPDTTKSRWGTLLVQFGLYKEAAHFINSLDSSRIAGILKNRLSSYNDTPRVSSIPLFVINLRKDTRKRQISEQSLWNAGFRNVEFYPATEAATIPHAAYERLFNTPESKATYGTVGCWMSHVSVWEAIAKGDSDFAVVLEDDAVPEFHCSTLEKFLDTHIDYDFVWLNERMSGKSHGVGDQLKPEPVDPWHLFSLWSDARTAVGADAYLVSRKAAAQLAHLAKVSGPSGHVDGMMAAWTLGEKSEPQNRIQRLLIEFQEKFGVSDAIRSTALSIPLFKEEDFGFSSRKAQDSNLL